MGAIKGQPTPKPSDLPSGPAPSFEEFAGAGNGNAPSFEDFSMGAAGGAAPSGANQEVPLVDPNSRTGYWTQKAADWAPAVGGFVGSVAGLPVGGPFIGGVAGAGAGGVAGNSIRRLIEINLLGKDPNSTLEQEIGGTVLAGAKEAGGQVLGGAIVKGAGKLISSVAAAPIEAVSKYTGALKERIEGPVLNFIANRTSKLSTEEAGDTAKLLLTKNIQTKYGPFIQAYSDLDSVAKAIPIADTSRLRFSNSVKAWALEAFPEKSDQWRVVKKFTDSFDASNTGAQFDNVLKAVGDAKRAAYGTGATAQGKFLGELENKATDFFEGEVTKLAGRVASGKAAPQEADFLKQIMQQRGIQDDPVKYAKQISRDYLKAKDAIKNDYRGFRSMLEDVAEQTKVKASKGPGAFMTAIQDVPSEKLVERMFDVKNARALRQMKAETPEVFDIVAKTKLGQLVKKSSPGRNLDLKALHTELNKMDAPVRSMLVTNAEMAKLEAAAYNPNLTRLERIQKRLVGQLGQGAADIVEIGKIVAPEFKKTGAFVNQAVGKSAIGLGELFSGNGQ